MKVLFALAVALVLDLVACGPVKKSPPQFFRVELVNTAGYAFYAGVGTKDWPWVDPTGYESRYLQPGETVTLYYPIPPDHLFVVTPQWASELSRGIDWTSAESFTVRVP